MLEEQRTLLRIELLDAIDMINDAHNQFMKIINSLRGLHPLDPNTEFTDQIYVGLKKEDSDALKELVRAICAAYLVSQIWISDARETKKAANWVVTEARKALESSRQIHGQKLDSLIEQLRQVGLQIESSERKKRQEETRAEEKEVREARG